MGTHSVSPGIKSFKLFLFFSWFGFLYCCFVLFYSQNYQQLHQKTSATENKHVFHLFLGGVVPSPCYMSNQSLKSGINFLHNSTWLVFFFLATTLSVVSRSYSKPCKLALIPFHLHADRLFTYDPMGFVLAKTETDIKITFLVPCKGESSIFLIRVAQILRYCNKKIKIVISS